MTTTTRHDRIDMRDRMYMPRSRGAVSGILLLLLGAWGALVPFWGPDFGYAFTPDVSWHFTWGRFWLEILPGAAAFLGGLWLLGSANKLSGHTGAWLGIAGGAWFVIGQEVSMLWNSGTPAAGTPTATSTLGVTVQQLGFFDGLGVVILFLAATALGRMSVIGVRDLRPRAAEGTVPEQRLGESETSAEERTTAEPGTESEHRRPIDH